MTKRTLPQIAERLREIAVETSNLELITLADEMKRNSPARKARATSVKMTDQVAEDIADYAKLHPHDSFTKIGRQFGVNIGRVSEVLNGKF